VLLQRPPRLPLVLRLVVVLWPALSQWVALWVPPALLLPLWLLRRRRLGLLLWAALSPRATLGLWPASSLPPAPSSA
jgi:hypothetical protein